MITRAADGADFYAKSEDQTCFSGLNILGIRKIPLEERVRFLFEEEHIFESREICRKVMGRTICVNQQMGDIIYFAPVKKALTKPDVVLVICNPKQAMDILYASIYTSDVYKAETPFGFAAACSGAVAQPIETGEVSFSLSDHGARKCMGMKTCELLVGIPGGKFLKIVRNLEALQSALKYKYIYFRNKPVPEKSESA